MSETMGGQFRAGERNGLKTVNFHERPMNRFIVYALPFVNWK